MYFDFHLHNMLCIYCNHDFIAPQKKFFIPVVHDESVFIGTNHELFIRERRFYLSL